ncbi:MAG: 1-aminocyclopropane-1-carboxylate deaminase [Zetaproteobacteria bacterium CG2_30_46_52]|nr:MAG: 1-aminocyclopropane-1-carboxylate deaminase [Zetaproteobacteria bacterium CG2_30_46_52]
MSISEVSPFSFRGVSYYVKRDELIHPLLSGNKYRKLYNLIQANPETYHTLISHGGAQSNAMLAIAALCQQKGWRFEYICKTLPKHLKATPMGNFKQALALGMQPIEVRHEAYDDAVIQARLTQNEGVLFIPQGGACPMAEAGIQKLAKEIIDWQQAQNVKQLTVATPSGTGTTAFYLAKALPNNRVLTTAVVGSNAYLKEQMQKLGELPNNLVFLEPTQKYQFAQPYPELFQIHQELNQAGICFDLIYASPMWLTLLANTQLIDGKLLYIHSGGLTGNASMLERYAHLGLDSSSR